MSDPMEIENKPCKFVRPTRVKKSKDEKQEEQHQLSSYGLLAYEMNRRERGIALIINQENFTFGESWKRNGSQKDVESLKVTLEGLKFTVKILNDLTNDKLFDEVDSVANEDHEHHDCLIVVIMSHGDDGIIYSKNKAYKLDEIIGKFTPDKCASLAEKPKLFFIQTCRGDEIDAGFEIKLKSQNIGEDGSECYSYKIPIYADFLVAYATIQGFVAFREGTGSWFIQTLCKELNENGKKIDLMNILTIVNRRIAYDFESRNTKDEKIHEKKQIPCITSMLTRVLKFPSD